MYITLKTDIPSSVETENFIGVLFKLAEKYQGLGFYHSVIGSSCYVIAIDIINKSDVIDKEGKENRAKLEDFQKEVSDYLKDFAPELKLSDIGIKADIPRFPAECDPCSLVEYMSSKISENGTALTWLPPTIKIVTDNIQKRFDHYYASYVAQIKQQRLYENPHERAAHFVAVEARLMNQANRFIERVLLGAYKFFSDYNNNQIPPERESIIGLCSYFKSGPCIQGFVSEKITDEVSVIIDFNGTPHFSELNLSKVALKFFESSLIGNFKFSNCEPQYEVQENSTGEKFRVILKNYVVQSELKQDFINSLREALLLAGLFEYQIENIHFNVSPQYKALFQKAPPALSSESEPSLQPQTTLSASSVPTPQM